MALTRTRTRTRARTLRQPSPDPTPDPNPKPNPSQVSGRLLIINRGKTNRTQLAARSAKHPRLLLYPEGTRRPHSTTPLIR